MSGIWKFSNYLRRIFQDMSTKVIMYLFIKVQSFLKKPLLEVKSWENRNLLKNGHVSAEIGLLSEF